MQAKTKQVQDTDKEPLKVKVGLSQSLAWNCEQQNHLEKGFVAITFSIVKG